MTGMTRDQAVEALTGPEQPYEFEAVVTRGHEIRAFRVAPKSLRALYADTATDLPFITYDAEHLTFKEAWQQASRIAYVLLNRFKIAPGDRVAISMRNYPEWILAFCAATSIGAIAVAMNAHWQDGIWTARLRSQAVICGSGAIGSPNEYGDATGIGRHRGTCQGPP
jgi:long-chain acyl-CoA synthetase